MTTRPAAARKPRLREHLRMLRREPLLAFWVLFLILDPIYTFKSGLPQPADILITLMGPFALAGWNGRLRRRSLRTMRALMMFMGYVLLSVVVWSLIYNTWSLDYKQGFLIAPLFYLFDVYVFLVILVLYERFGERFVWLTVRVVLVSVCFQVLMTFIYTRGGTLRTYGLFNTSNQLGYFSILTASLLLLGQRRLQLTSLQVLVGQVCCAYLALLSASRAALISVGILGAVAVINRFRTVLVLGAFAAFLTFVTNPFESAMERSRNRIQNDQTLGFFEERGYDRLVHNPEYLILGAGEGRYQRFADTTAIGTHELHSSIGTLLFCYGVVGLSLFLAFLVKVVRGSGIRRTLLLLPPAAYGLTHQGLRFTLFWVLLAFVVMLNDLDERARLARGKPTETRGS